MKRLLQFIKFQLNWQLLRKRWLLPIPVILFLCYRAWNYLSSNMPGFTPEVNVWDMLFVIFGNFFNVLFAFGLLFMYLVSDLMPENDLGQLMLVRLKKRSVWWLGKTLTLLVLVLVFVLGVALIAGTVASITLPISSDYSPHTMQSPERVNLSMRYFRAEPPPTAKPLGLFMMELGMLAMGLFAFGLVMMIINQVTGKYTVGLISLFALIVLSYLGSMLNGPPVWSDYLPGRHISLIDLMPVRRFPVQLSLLYWSVWIVLAWGIGWFVSRRQSYYGMQE